MVTFGPRSRRCVQDVSGDPPLPLLVPLGGWFVCWFVSACLLHWGCEIVCECSGGLRLTLCLWWCTSGFVVAVGDGDVWGLALGAVCSTRVFSSSSTRWCDVVSVFSGGANSAFAAVSMLHVSRWKPSWLSISLGPPLALDGRTFSILCCKLLSAASACRWFIQCSSWCVQLDLPAACWSQHYVHKVQGSWNV